MHSVVSGRDGGEVPEGHQGTWNESKLSALSDQLPDKLAGLKALMWCGFAVDFSWWLRADG